MAIPKDMEERKRLSAVCGLFCPSCTVFIGTKEDPQRTQSYR